MAIASVAKKEDVMARCVCITLLGSCLAAGTVSAQVSPDSVTASVVESATTVTRDIAPLQSAARDVPLVRDTSPKRPTGLLPMYGSLAVLQAADFVSTTRVLSSGAGYEANPVMRGVTGSPAAFLAVKAGSTAGLIWVAERMRRTHPVRALVLMASSNALMAAVVAHNVSVR